MSENYYLSNKGFIDINSSTKYYLWDGISFSNLNPITNQNDKLYKITLSNGNQHICNFNFINKIEHIYQNLPIINTNISYFDSFTRGLYASQLHDTDENIIITEDYNILSKLSYDYYIKDNNYYLVHVNYYNKYFVPYNSCLKDKISWLDGFLSNTFKIFNDFIILDGNSNLLKNISKLLQTCGINPFIKNYKLYISLSDLYKFNLSSLDIIFDFTFKNSINIPEIIIKIEENKYYNK
jgi:hypothetical protein